MSDSTSTTTMAELYDLQCLPRLMRWRIQLGLWHLPSTPPLDDTETPQGSAPSLVKEEETHDKKATTIESPLVIENNQENANTNKENDNDAEEDEDGFVDLDLDPHTSTTRNSNSVSSSNQSIPSDQAVILIPKPPRQKVKPTIEMVQKYNVNHTKANHERYRQLYQKHMWKNSPLELIQGGGEGEALMLHKQQQQHLDKAGVMPMQRSMDPLTALLQAEQTPDDTVKQITSASPEPLDKTTTTTTITSINDEPPPPPPQNTDGWKEFYTNREIIDLIYKDLKRLPPRIVLLHSPTTTTNNNNNNGATPQPDDEKQRKERLAALADILFLYSREHADVGYRQGMHEVLAHFVMQLEMEHEHHQPQLSQPSHSNRSTQDDKTGASWDIRPESYLLFEAFMHHLKPAYQDSTTTPQSSPQTTTTKTPSSSQPQPQPPPLEGGTAAMGKRILTLLHQTSPPIHNLISQMTAVMGAPPQLYCAKWIRLVFGRELEDGERVLELWDGFLGLLWEAGVVFDGMEDEGEEEVVLVEKGGAAGSVRASAAAMVKARGVKVRLMDILECAACAMILLQSSALLQTSTYNLNKKEGEDGDDADEEDSLTLVMHDCLTLLMNCPCMSSSEELMKLTKKNVRRLMAGRVGLVVLSKAELQKKQKQQLEEEQRQKERERMGQNGGGSLGNGGVSTVHQQQIAGQGRMSQHPNYQPSHHYHQQQQQGTFRGRYSNTPSNPLQYPSPHPLQSQSQPQPYQHYPSSTASRPFSTRLSATSGIGSGKLFSKASEMLGAAKVSCQNAIATVESRMATAALQQQQQQLQAQQQAQFGYPYGPQGYSRQQQQQQQQQQRVGQGSVNGSSNFSASSPSSPTVTGVGGGWNVVGSAAMPQNQSQLQAQPQAQVQGQSLQGSGRMPSANLRGSRSQQVNPSLSQQAPQAMTWSVRQRQTSGGQKQQHQQYQTQLHHQQQYPHGQSSQQNVKQPSQLQQVPPPPSPSKAQQEKLKEVSLDLQVNLEIVKKHLLPSAAEQQQQNNKMKQAETKPDGIGDVASSKALGLEDGVQEKKNDTTDRVGQGTPAVPTNDTTNTTATVSKSDWDPLSCDNPLQPSPSHSQEAVATEETIQANGETAGNQKEPTKSSPKPPSVPDDVMQALQELERLQKMIASMAACPPCGTWDI